MDKKSLALTAIMTFTTIATPAASEAGTNYHAYDVLGDPDIREVIDIAAGQPVGDYMYGHDDYGTYSPQPPAVRTSEGGVTTLCDGYNCAAYSYMTTVHGMSCKAGTNHFGQEIVACPNGETFTFAQR